MTSAEDKAKKKFLHAFVDFLVTPHGALILLVFFGGTATFKNEIMNKLGFKSTASDVVELSDEDQKLLHDVAQKTDETAKAVATLTKAHEDLASEFRNYLIMQAAGRRLSDARVNR